MAPGNINITIDTSRIVFYHGNCNDGFTAAWLYSKIYPQAIFIPVNYGQDCPVSLEDLREKDIAFLDFSYKRPQMEQIINVCNSLLVLDHHKSAEAELKSITYDSDKVTIVFDMDECGASLVHKYFNLPADSYNYFIRLVKDRDLWQKQYPETDAFSAALRSYSQTFQTWDEINFDIKLYIQEGEAILRYQDIVVEQHVRKAIEVDFYLNEIIDNERQTVKVLGCNATTMFSEIAGELAKDKPFAFCYFFRDDGKVQFSLRSSPDGWDVADLARKFGGGGHKHAAGFEVSVAKFLDITGLGNL